eukprot:2388559-Rhodomonas_salina.3
MASETREKHTVKEKHTTALLLKTVLGLKPQYYHTTTLPHYHTTLPHSHTPTLPHSHTSTLAH